MNNGHLTKEEQIKISHVTTCRYKTRKQLSLNNLNIVGSIQLCVHQLPINISSWISSTSGAFASEILETMNKCLYGTTCIVMYIIGTNL